eukprot:2978301-Rhodomonas_salina.4
MRYLDLALEESSRGLIRVSSGHCVAQIARSEYGTSRRQMLVSVPGIAQRGVCRYSSKRSVSTGA